MYWFITYGTSDQRFSFFSDKNWPSVFAVEAEMKSWSGRSLRENKWWMIRCSRVLDTKFFGCFKDLQILCFVLCIFWMWGSTVLEVYTKHCELYIWYVHTDTFFILQKWWLYSECRFEDTGMTVKENINDCFPLHPKLLRSAVSIRNMSIACYLFPIIKQENVSTVNLSA